MQTYTPFQYYNPYWYIYCLSAFTLKCICVVLLCLCKMKGGRASEDSGEASGDGVKLGKKVQHDRQSLYNGEQIIN